MKHACKKPSLHISIHDAENGRLVGVLDVDEDKIPPDVPAKDFIANLEETVQGRYNSEIYIRTKGVFATKEGSN